MRPESIDMTDKNPQQVNVPERPEPTHVDQRIHPVPGRKQRAEREADKLALKSAGRE